MADFLKKIAYAGTSLVTGLLVASIIYDSFDQRKILKQEDFKKAEWIEVKKVNNELKRFYLGENISHRPENWHTYFDSLVEKNPHGLEENVKFPDLDDDGKVGKLN